MLQYIKEIPHFFDKSPSPSPQTPRKRYFLAGFCTSRVFLSTLKVDFNVMDDSIEQYLSDFSLYFYWKLTFAILQSSVF